MGMHHSRNRLCGPGPCCTEQCDERETGSAWGLYAVADEVSVSGKPVMGFTDRVLQCVECGGDFVFTAGEQLFFHDKQFLNDPKRCKQCKGKRGSGGSRVRSETRTTCSECGDSTTVPFKPSQGRPVLCRSCFQKQPPKPPAQAAAPAQEGLDLPLEEAVSAELS
jgi:CxxC-x17-CxxC domain-containing protein